MLLLSVLCEPEFVKCFGITGVRTALWVRPEACPALDCTAAVGGAIEGDDTVLATFCGPSQDVRCSRGSEDVMLSRVDFISSDASCPTCLASTGCKLLLPSVGGEEHSWKVSHSLFLTTLTWTVLSAVEKTAFPLPCPVCEAMP